jgi:hypothetical protein
MHRLVHVILIVPYELHVIIFQCASQITRYFNEQETFYKEQQWHLGDCAVLWLKKKDVGPKYYIYCRFFF